MGRSGFEMGVGVVLVVVDSNDKYTKRKMSASRAVHDNSDQFIYSSCGSWTRTTDCCVVGYRAFCHGYGRSTGDVDPTALMMDDEREPPKQSIEFVIVT